MSGKGKTLVLGVSILTLLSLIVIFFVVRGDSGVKPASDDAPVLTVSRPKLDTRLFFADKGTAESEREVEYWPGTEVRKQLDIEYRNGDALHVEFRRDGTAKSLVEYQLASGSLPDTTNGVGSDFEAVRVLKRRIEYGEDGISVVDALFYRADSTVAAASRTLPGGRFEQIVYDKDGASILEHQLFNSSGSLIYMRLLGGNRQHYVERSLDDGGIEKIAFREDGTRLYRMVKGPRTNNEDYDFFAADGVTRMYTVYRHLRVSVLYYRPDGQVDHYREFFNDEMTVIRYRDNAGTDLPSTVGGKRPAELYRQYWKFVKERNEDGSPSEKGHYVLDRVDEHDQSGATIRKLHFKDGKVFKVDYLDQKGLSEKVVILRDDGTVERIDHYDRTGSGPASIKSEDVPQEKGLKESHDPVLSVDDGFGTVIADPRNDVGAPVAPYYPYDGYYDDYMDD